MSSQQEPTENSRGWKLWKCGSCEKPFATEELDSVENCPHCGSEVLVASEHDFQVIRE